MIEGGWGFALVAAGCAWLGKLAVNAEARFVALVSNILSSLVAGLICGAIRPPANAAELYIAPPNSTEMSAMFHSPDDWRKVRQQIAGIIQADHALNKVGDAELAFWFQRMDDWKLKLELEVGAIKPWSTKGDETFWKQRGGWDRIEHLGGHISSIVMDGPFAFAFRTLHQPLELAVSETAKFIALVRQYYPDVRIGDIEPFPSISIEEHSRWLDTLHNELSRRGVHGLDFYRLDVNWVVFITEAKSGWPSVVTIQHICRDRALPFSLIYWASDYPLHKTRGLADNSTWYTSIMAEGYNYAAAGGRPDQYVIESWLDTPTTALPESDRSSFTGSVLQFALKFVE